MLISDDIDFVSDYYMMFGLSKVYILRYRRRNKNLPVYDRKTKEFKDLLILHHNRNFDIATGRFYLEMPKIPEKPKNPEEPENLMIPKIVKSQIVPKKLIITKNSKNPKIF
jgi:hypothetical protein